MELFSELYGCYYTVVARILERAKYGITKSEIEAIVNENAFYESAFHLLPQLFSGEWDLLNKRQNYYFSKMNSSTFKRSMTNLEKAWIKALLLDARISLFLSDNEINSIHEILSDVIPLFSPNDFHTFDVALDGDNIHDPNYRKNFQTIFFFLNKKEPMLIEYESGKGSRITGHFMPYKISYSAKDDKFRLKAGRIMNTGTAERVTINISRIKSVQASKKEPINADVLHQLFALATCSHPILLEISKERNALERCMLQFASWDKQTEFMKEKNYYLCKIFYDKEDETELLIRILSFGPAIKVLGPDQFLALVKDRILRQWNLNIS